MPKRYSDIKDTKMEIRAHHILCTRAFKGKGYSKTFEQNMYKTITKIKQEGKIILIKTADAICSCCPENINGKCMSENKVRALDKNTIIFLNLTKRKYLYSEIEKIIQENLTEDVYNKICSECEWKHKNICTYADVQRPLM